MGPFPQNIPTGKAPRIDQQTCRQTGEERRTLCLSISCPISRAIGGDVQDNGDGRLSRMPREKRECNMPRPRRAPGSGKMLPPRRGSDLSEHWNWRLRQRPAEGACIRLPTARAGTANLPAGVRATHARASVTIPSRSATATIVTT